MEARPDSLVVAAAATSCEETNGADDRFGWFHRFHRERPRRLVADRKTDPAPRPGSAHPKITVPRISNYILALSGPRTPPITPIAPLVPPNILLTHLAGGRDAQGASPPPTAART